MSFPAPKRSAKDDREFQPQQLLPIIRKRWPLTVTIIGAVMLVTVFFTLSQKKIYRATASIQIDPTSLQPLGRHVEQVVAVGAGNYWTNREYTETQFKIIQSQAVAVEVVRTLGLHKDAAFLANVPAGVPAPAKEVPLDAAAVMLRGRVSVDPIRNSRLVNISLEDADPARAQRMLAALADVYLEQNIQNVLSSTNSASEWLHGQLEKLNHDLESSENSLHAYKEERQILSVSIDDQSNMLREEIKAFNDELTRARAKREQMAARRNELASVNSEDPTELPATELLSSAVLQNIRQHYLTAKKDCEALLGEGKGANHPESKAAEAKILALRTALLAEVSNIRGAVDRDLAALDREIAGLSRLFESAKRRALDLNLLEIEFHRLERTKQNNEKLYSLVLERTKESDLARMLRFNNIRVIDTARASSSPIFPRTGLNLSVGLFFGVILGVLGGVAREYFDRSVKTPEDVENELSLAFLGLLPEISTGGQKGSYGRRRSRAAPANLAQPQPELSAHYDSTSGLAEASRAIRTNLMFMAPDKPYRRLLVTSAGPSEGKTMVACCIAVAMAQAGQKVLLLDCDLRRPRLHRVFRLPNETGVTTLMLDHSALEAHVVRTDVDNLHVLSAGPLAPNPAELLQSASFSKLLDALQERFDRIIIDSPPIVPVTDPAVLSKYVDGTLLVIRAFKTSRDLARQAVRSLRDVNAPLIGAILNSVDLSRREYGYYHYYYYKSEGYKTSPNVASA